MPIYAYRCASCGFAKDVLQKMSDAALTQCPSCSASAFQKQVTAAGFQLKGSGWYATDFKGAAPAAGTGKEADASANSTDSAKSADSATAKPESAAPAPAATPAPAGSSSGA